MADGKDKPKPPNGADDKPSSFAETDGIDWFIMSDFNDLLSGSSTTLEPNVKPSTKPSIKSDLKSNPPPPTNPNPSRPHPPSPQSASTNQGNPFIDNQDEDDAAWLAELDLDSPVVSDLSLAGTILSGLPQENTPQEPPVTTLRKLPARDPSTTKSSSHVTTEAPQPEPSLAAPEGIDWLILSNLEENISEASAKNSAANSRPNPGLGISPSSNSSFDHADLDLDLDFGSDEHDQILAAEFINGGTLESLSSSTQSDLEALDRLIGTELESDIAISEDINDELASLLADESVASEANSFASDDFISDDLADLGSEDSLADSSLENDLLESEADVDAWLQGFSEPELLSEVELSAAPEIAPAPIIAAKPHIVPSTTGNVQDHSQVEGTDPEDNIWESIGSTNSGAQGDDLGWQNDGDLAPWDQPVVNNLVTNKATSNPSETDSLDTAIVFDFNQFSATASATAMDDWLETSLPSVSGPNAKPVTDGDEFGDMVWHIPGNDDDFGDTVVTGWIEPAARTSAKAKPSVADDSNLSLDLNSALNTPSATNLSDQDPFAVSWDSPAPVATGANPAPAQLGVNHPESNDIGAVTGSNTILHTNSNAAELAPEALELMTELEHEFGNDISHDTNTANVTANHANNSLLGLEYDLGGVSASHNAEAIAPGFWEDNFDAMLATEELSDWESDPVDQSNYLDHVANELFQYAPDLEKSAPDAQPPQPSGIVPPPPVHRPTEPSSQVTTLHTPSTARFDAPKDDFEDALEGQFQNEFDYGFSDELNPDFSNYDLGVGESPADYGANYQEFMTGSGVEGEFDGIAAATQTPNYATHPNGNYPDTNYLDHNLEHGSAAEGLSSGGSSLTSSISDYGTDYGGDDFNLDPYAATALDIDLVDFSGVIADDFMPSGYIEENHPNPDYASSYTADYSDAPIHQPLEDQPNFSYPDSGTGLIPSPQATYLNNAPHHTAGIPSPSTDSFSKPISTPISSPMGNIDNDYLDNFDLDEFDSSVGGLSPMSSAPDASFNQAPQADYTSPSSAHNPLPLPPLPKMPPLPPLPHNKPTNRANPNNKGMGHGNTGSTAAADYAPQTNVAQNMPQPPRPSSTQVSTGTTINPPPISPRPRGNSSGTVFDDDFLRSGGRSSTASNSGGSAMDTGFNTGRSPVLSDFNDIGGLDIRDDTDWTGLLDGDSELSDSFTAMPISSYGTPKLPDQSGFFTGETDDLPRHRQPPLVAGNTGLTGFGSGPRPTPTPQIADQFRPPYPSGQIGNTGISSEKENERPSLPVSISLEAIWDKAKWPIVGLILLLIGGGGMMLLQRPYTELGLKLGFIKDVSGKNLQGANFKDAKLENVNFSGANLEAVVFENANLKGADLSDAKLDGVNFAKANLRGTRLLRTSIVWANFKGAQLNLADLEGADVNRSNFAGATLQGANLRGMKLGEGDKMARLEPRDRLMWQLVNEPKPGRNLAGQNLMGFNLNGAVLTGANLTNSQLSFVDLTGADLKNANLSGATVKGMNLSGAKLNGAQFTGAVWDKDKPPKTDAATVCPNGKPGPCKF